MFKRVLHAANQVVTHEETHTGKELAIENTVNAPAEVRVRGDSWQGKTDGVNVYAGGSVTAVWKNTDDIGHNVNDGAFSLALKCQNIFQNGAFLLFDCNEDVPICSNIQIRSLALVNNWGSSKIQYIKKGENKVKLPAYEFVEGQKTVGIQIRKNNYNEAIGTRYTFTLSNILVKAGQDEHEYEPYTGNAPSPSPEYTQDIISVSGILKSTNNGLGGRDKLRESQITIPELRAIPGTDVRDELVVYEDGSGKIVRRVYKVPQSSFRIIHWSSPDSYAIHSSNIPTPNTAIKAICNIAYKYSAEWNAECTHYFLQNYAQKVVICLNYEKYPTKDDVQAVIDKGIDFYYALEEPTEEPLTAAEVQGILRTHQYHTEIGFEGLDEHLEPEVEVGCRVLGR